MNRDGSQVRDGKESVKFMQVLDRRIFFKLKDMARNRGVTVQELIRVLVIPDWMRKSQEENRRTEDRRRNRGWRGPVAARGPPEWRVRPDGRNGWALKSKQGRWPGPKRRRGSLVRPYPRGAGEEVIRNRKI